MRGAKEIEVQVKAEKKPTRKQLVAWLAMAIRFVPDNLVSLKTGKRPEWVKEARKECERNGVRFSKG